MRIMRKTWANTTRTGRIEPISIPQYEIAQLTAEVHTPDGALRGEVAVYSGPTHLAELIPPLQTLSEGLLGLVLKRERQAGRQIACRAGCGACCRQMVPLSIPEIFYLRDLVAALPPDRKKTVCRRFEQTVADMEHKGLNERLRNPDNTEGDNVRIAGDYFKMDLPCPFLENETCSIHPARPLACREYFVTTPAAWCTTPLDRAIRRVRAAAPMPVVLAHLTADLLSLPPKLIPLTLSLHWAIENEELHQLTWPGRQLFEQFLAKFNSWGKNGPSPESPAEND